MTAIITPALDYVGGIVVEPRDIIFESAEALHSLGEGLRSFLASLDDGVTLHLLYRVDDAGEAGVRAYAGVGRNAASPALEEHVRSRVKWLEELRWRRVRLFVFFSRPRGASFVRGELGSALPFANGARLAESKHRMELERLGGLRDKVVSRLQQLGLSSREMTREEARQVHYELLNPRRACQHLSAPRAPEQRLWSEEDIARHGEHLREYTEAEQLTCEDIDERYDHWIQEGRVRRVCSLKILPENGTLPVMGEHLLYLKAAARGGGEQLFPFWLGLTIHVASQRERKSALNRRSRFVGFTQGLMSRLGMAGNSVAQDIEDAAAQQSIVGALTELQQSSSKIVDVSMTLLLEGSSVAEVDAQLEGARAAFNALGNSELYQEAPHKLPVFFGMFPGAVNYPVRRKACTTRNAADLLPLYAPWRGTAQPMSLLQTPAGDAVAFDFFDPSVPATHGICAAATGSGKSFQIGSLVLDARAKGYEAILLDNGASWRRMTTATGGSYLPVSLDTSLAPFGDYRSMLDEKGQLRQSALSEVVQFLQVCAADEVLPLFDKLYEGVAYRAVQAAYIDLRHQPSRRPVMSDFVRALRERRAPEDARIAEDIAQRLWLCTEGPYAGMLNVPCTLDFSAPLITFDLEALSKNPTMKALALATITRIVEMRAERALAERRALTLFAIDEAHQLLKTPATEAFIEYGYRTFRKKGVACWLISQQFNDFVAAKSGKTLIENSTLKMVLRHPQGGYDHLIEHFHLTPRAAAALESLSTAPGIYSDFYLMFGDRQTVIRNQVSPYVYWLLTTDRYDTDLLSRAKEKNPGLSELELIRHLAHEFPRGARSRRSSTRAA
ncbi:TraC family protein (plasmid) [Myxococcus sp. MxC21-1]|uniref:TraG/VirB4 family ATPase n=1 Tax=Myxococcus sp. MxC21-1 TaxID=3041439 RepID=UPI0029319564|nr:TraC family protein [Myxococcus sp. MxC21-1]WNZ66221.1 TraC family protein [Myxococcus sp. MxC21-1]